VVKVYTRAKYNVHSMFSLEEGYLMKITILYKI
jgi:hypothetical protein